MPFSHRTRPRVLACAALLTSVLFLPVVASADAGAGDLVAELDAYLNGLYPSDEPGAAVIVVKDGQTVFQNGYGMGDLEHGLKLTPDMVFRIGSITKQFTAVAILMLEEEGKLSVNDEVSKHLKDYPTHGKTITIEHLLTHTSGIPSYTDLPGWMQSRVREDFGSQEMLAEWKDLPLEFEPGTQYRYNNSAYFMLGVIIEEVSGMSYGEFIETRIFAPLQMTSSRFDHERDIIPRRASGYEQDGDQGFVNAPFLDMDIPGAAGSLLSTVGDLAKWDAALYTDQLLSADSRKRLWTSAKLNDGEETGYGYGWALGEHDGKKVIRHSGGIFGFRSDGIRIPDERLYVAVLSNGARVGPALTSQRLASRMLGGALPGGPVDVAPEVLEELTGVYRVDEESMRVVTVENGVLYTQRDGGPRFAVKPLGGDRFYYDTTSTIAQFVREDGRAVAMEMHRFAEPLERAERTDEAIPEGPKVAAVDPAVYENYRGSYQLAPGFVLKVWPEDGKLLTQATGQPSIEIFPESETVFFNQAIGGKITFTVGDDGKATKLILEQRGQKMEAARVDEESGD